MREVVNEQTTYCEIMYIIWKQGESFHNWILHLL